MLIRLLVPAPVLRERVGRSAAAEWACRQARPLPLPPSHKWAREALNRITQWSGSAQQTAFEIFRSICRQRLRGIVRGDQPTGALRLLIVYQ